MGSCIICGRDVDGHICQSHEEDVVFEFRGDSPDQLVSGRFYRGVVDGYADFGVFVDLSPNVTGLLHRSELDKRLESLDWEPGDTVFVQVKNVRDNGNVDLTSSIRESEREFRGSLIQTESGEEKLPEEDEDEEGESGNGSSPDGSAAESTGDESTQAEASSPETHRTPEPAAEREPAESEGEDEDEEISEATAARQAAVESVTTESTEAPEEAEATEAAESAEGPEEVESAERSEAAEARTERESESETETETLERVEIGSLSDRVGETVRIEGEVVGARQTGGPTVFELRDETGVVDCAAFVEAGVRAYPEIEVGDIVRLDGEVEVRRNEIQVETEALAALDGEERETVERRLADAMTAKARPDTFSPLADHGPVQAVSEPVLDAAEAIRRAILESRPIVVRHAATADGYVASAAIERAVLPLIREEHNTSDAEYHYFTRRPLDEAVYGMDAATKDVTRMLQDRDRHDEKLPLVLLVGTGSTRESLDGLEMLDIYGAKRVVVDAAAADPEVGEEADVLVNPEHAGADAADLSTGALGANLAAAVNEDVRETVAHLPAVSYWADTPEAYTDLASEAGFDAEAVTELREAVALEAFYQSYEDKRELITDLLFGDEEAEPHAGAPEDAEVESLAGHIAGQFREKLDTEIQTAEANLDSHETGGVRFSVLDADAFTHRYDFPPTTLLLDELHRRNADGDAHVTVGVAMDELYLRADEDLDVRAVAAEAAELAPEAGITAEGVREGRIEFLSGARESVEDAVIAAITDQIN